MADTPEDEGVKPNKPSLEDLVPDCDKPPEPQSLDSGGGGGGKPPKPGSGG